MPDSSIVTLVEQIEREFGVSIPISPAHDVSTVPTPLQPLYTYSDGLTLPFANIHKIADFDRATFPNWICFGSDSYFSHFLCHHSNTPSLTTWDHEAGHDIEGVFDTVFEWLTDEYESFVDAATDDNTVHVTSVPDGASRTAAIAELKKISGKSSSELLDLLRPGKFEVVNVVRSQAFATVRDLHRLGISCYVECERQLTKL